MSYTFANTSETGQLTKLRISRICLALQTPEALDEEKISRYVARLLAGEPVGPVRVYLDHHQKYWLANGFHRLEAAKKAGRQLIDAVVIRRSISSSFQRVRPF